MFLKKSEKEAWWLTKEDKEFISSYRKRLWVGAMAVFLLGLIMVAVSTTIK